MNPGDDATDAHDDPTWVGPAHGVSLPSAVASSLASSLVHATTLAAGVELFGLHYLVANAGAAVPGALTNFLINKKVAFRAPHGSALQQGGRYAIASTTSLAWMTLLMYVGTDVAGLPYLVSWTGAAAMVMLLLSYPAHRVYIFSAGVTRPAGHPIPARGQRVLVLLGTVGGLGRSPLAPGTVGTLAALPLIVALADQPDWVLAVFAAAVSGTAIIVAEPLGQLWDAPDDQRIVIDEVAGMLVAMVAVPVTATTLAVGFIAFRAADVLKPWPASAFDRRKDGLGCVMDDVAAGVQVALGMQVLLWAWGGAP